MAIILGTHLTCKTNSGDVPRNSCVFPFKESQESSVVYNKCIIFAGNSTPSCAISVDEFGIGMDWGFCSPGCPVVSDGMPVMLLNLFSNVRSYMLLCCWYLVSFVYSFEITGQYGLTNWGKKCSDLGKQQLKTKASCIDAAESLGLHLESSQTAAGYPGGCYLNRGSKVYWNKDPNGQSFPNNRGICLLGI